MLFSFIIFSVDDLERILLESWATPPPPYVMLRSKVELSLLSLLMDTASNFSVDFLACITPEASIALSFSLKGLI